MSGTSTPIDNALSPGQTLATILIIIATVVFVRGWWHLHRQERVRIYSLVAFIAGLLLLSLALVSPLYNLATRFFSARVFFHLLLVAWIPGLLLVGDPLPSIARGLPQPGLNALRGRLRSLRHAPRWHAWLQWITRPGLVLFAFMICIWLWYDPSLHQASMRYGWIRSLEVITLLTVALLNWWHISGATPYLHPPMAPLLRIVYTLAGALPMKLVGGILLFSQGSAYVYPDSFRFSGLDITDQSLGGIVVWALGGVIYSSTAAILARQWLGKEESKPQLPPALWDTEESMLAPGIKRESR